jgi:hypothetical protein
MDARGRSRGNEPSGLVLDRHAAGTKATPREVELLAENARPWLGELISLLYDVEYERGFPAKGATGDGNDKEARSWPLLGSGHGTQIEWSTITSLSMARHASIGTRGLLLGSRLVGLRELVGVGMGDFSALLSRDRPALEHLALAGGSNAAPWSETIAARAREILARMPSLKRLRIAAPLGVLETIVGGPREARGAERRCRGGGRLFRGALGDGRGTRAGARGDVP